MREPKPDRGDEKSNESASAAQRQLEGTALLQADDDTLRAWFERLNEDGREQGWHGELHVARGPSPSLSTVRRVLADAGYTGLPVRGGRLDADLPNTPGPPDRRPGGKLHNLWHAINGD